MYKMAILSNSNISLLILQPTVMKSLLLLAGTLMLAIVAECQYSGNSLNVINILKVLLKCIFVLHRD